MGDPAYCPCCGRVADKLEHIDNERFGGMLFSRYGCCWCEALFWLHEKPQEYTHQVRRKLRGLES